MNDPATGLRRAGDAKLAFDSVFVQGVDGKTRGRWPRPPDAEAYYAMSFDARDYFRGALRHAAERRRAAYVSDAFRSKADDMYKIGISRPVFAEDGKTVVGVFVATAATDPTFGSQTFSGASRTAALAARLEGDGSRAEPSYIVLLHEGLKHGQFVAMDNPRVRAFPPHVTRDQLQLRPPDAPLVTDPYYLDPAAELPPAAGFNPRGYAGRWLAAFAPVGNTPLVVIVETRFEDAVALDKQAASKLAWVAGGALVIVLALIGLALAAATRRQRMRSS